jgi:hypothetical protein
MMELTLTDTTNEIGIQIEGKTIAGSYELNRGMVTVNGGTLGSKSTQLGGHASAELLARRLLRELHAQSRGLKYADRRARQINYGIVSGRSLRANTRALSHNMTNRPGYCLTRPR